LPGDGDTTVKPNGRGRSRSRVRLLLVAVVALMPVACGLLGGIGDAQLRDRANGLLQRWAERVATAPAGAIIFVGDLTQGGGWTGDKANDDKMSFLSGLLIANPALSDEIPAAGTASWPDGSTQQVALVSAAAALRGLVEGASAGKCDGCQPIQVIGATLVLGKAETSHGPATVPQWQFNFVPADTPIDPITRVAVADAVAVSALEQEEASNSAPTRTIAIDAAYGQPDDTTITVSFTGSPDHGGSPCGADYTAEAVESDIALVIIVHSQGSVGIGACAAVGAPRVATATLAAPLGNRTILDAQNGAPVAVKFGPAPSDQSRP